MQRQTQGKASPGTVAMCAAASKETAGASGLDVVGCRLTWVHGHKRAGYYRVRHIKTSVAPEPGAPFTDLPTR